FQSLQYFKILWVSPTYLYISFYSLCPRAINNIHPLASCTLIKATRRYQKGLFRFSKLQTNAGGLSYPKILRVLFDKHHINRKLSFDDFWINFNNFCLK